MIQLTLNVSRGKYSASHYFSFWGFFGMFRHSGVGFGFELQPTIFEVVHFRYFEEKIMLISILLGKSGPFRLESQLKKA